ncbi:MAG: ATP-binding protein [Pyrinomonadaceae bacterium]
MRANEAMIIVGRKHTGKSTLANKLAEGFARPKKRVLIINVNQSPAYSKHKLITYDKMKRWRSGGIYQFYDRDNDAMFDFLINWFDPVKRKFNGLIVFEDCTKYIGSNPNKQILSFLVDHRMWNADLLFTFHSLAMVPPFFWRMTTRLILLKTQDIMTKANERGFENRIPNWKEVKPAYDRVAANPDPYAHEVIDTKI